MPQKNNLENRKKNNKKIELEELINFSNATNETIQEEINWIKKTFPDCNISFQDNLSDVNNKRSFDFTKVDESLLNIEWVNSNLQKLYLSFQNKHSFFDNYSFRSHEVDNVLNLLNQNSDLNDEEEDKIADLSITTRIVINKIEI